MSLPRSSGSSASASSSSSAAGSSAAAASFTAAGSAPSLGKHLLMAYLPPEQARVGNELAVSYMEELYPVTVISQDATPPFDPDNERIR